MKIWLFLLVLSASAGEFELFCDWEWDAKGQMLFPLSEDAEEKDLSLMSLLRKKLNQQGDEIRSWEMERYRSHLLTWKALKSWTDWKAWVRIPFLKKNPVDLNRCWIFWNLGPKLKDLDLSGAPRDKMILVMWEPPTVQPELYDPAVQSLFGKIFTWDDDLVDNRRFFKMHYPVLLPRIANVPSFEEKKFCIMICRHLTSRHPQELYSKRREAIEFFEDKPGELDLYGFYWEKKKYQNWKGPLHGHKIDKLKEYKFSICYENMRDVKGYITEKIFDCFAAGVVPVYSGASNVGEYIPADCFIDRRQFGSEEEVYRFLKSVSKEEYLGYLDRAERFLRSDRAKMFSREYFTEHLARECRLFMAGFVPKEFCSDIIR